MGGTSSPSIPERLSKALSRWVPSPVEALLLEIRRRERAEELGSSTGAREGTILLACGATALMAWVAMLASGLIGAMDHRTRDGTVVALAMGMGFALSVGVVLVEAVGSRDPRHMLARRLALGVTTAAGVGVGLSLWSVRWVDPYYGGPSTMTSHAVPGVGWLFLAVPVLHAIFWRLGARSWAFFRRAVLGLMAATMLLTLAAGVTAWRHTAPSAYPMNLPAIELGAIPSTARSDNGWQLTRSGDDADGNPAAVVYTRREGDLRFTASCMSSSECALTATLRDRVLEHDGRTTWAVNPSSPPTVRSDAERGLYWFDVSDLNVSREWQVFRASDGRNVPATLELVAPSVAPPWAWVAYGLFFAGLSALLLMAGRHAVGTIWSKPETWIEGTLGDDRMITFRNGAPRPASSWFQGYTGPVTVIPTAQSVGGPFRGDGSPDDGWAIPGSRAALVEMVNATRGMVDGSIFALLLVGVAPLVAAVFRGLIHL